MSVTDPGNFWRNTRMSKHDKLFADNKENNKRLRAAAKSQGMKTARQKDREFLKAQVSTTDRAQILADLRRLAKALKASQ